jgi:hypothetical protein
MNDQKQLMQILVDSLKRISFAERFKRISENHNESNYDLLPQRVDKKQILQILKDLGYKFTYIPIERFFCFGETIDDFEFKTDIKIKSGICTIYMIVIHQGEYINHHTNLGFLYRYLIGDMSAPITAPKYRDYQEFRTIARSLMSLLEDLKEEFLRAYRFSNNNK